MERFNAECLLVEDLQTQTALVNLLNGLKPGPFMRLLSKNYPKNLEELQKRA